MTQETKRDVKICKDMSGDVFRWQDSRDVDGETQEMSIILVLSIFLLLWFLGYEPFYVFI